MVVVVEKSVDEKEDVVDTWTVYLAAPPTRDHVSVGVLDEVLDDGDRPDGAAGAAEAGVVDITEKTSATTKLMGAAHLRRFREIANTLSPHVRRNVESSPR